ncbi:hypothetical protein B0T22DRAFT_442727 [Podospora appendiculata]|uniref:DUF1754-domain-containing protein n=1 Tax=Podospora appendiculata TaxID=314037 RepID=A0AAE0X5H7_9PEZI|nr:hypothetical protein B0T22DRAFT_442727 [Podospora appendiculata]
MPPEDYAAVNRGVLKLKGGNSKVKKPKHKKSKTKGGSDLEKALSTGDNTINITKPLHTDDDALETRAKKQGSSSRRGYDGEEQDDDKQTQPQQPRQGGGGSNETATETGEAQDQEQLDLDELKTDAEKRFAEIKRKRLRELAESARVRPELLKTHKQRVEELNSALSRLSEHHDMPKIGPG